MRIAKCIKPLRIDLLGSKSSVAIRDGWEGDLDQVIGERVIPAKRDPDDPSKVLEPERRVGETIADMLGHHLTPDSFRETPAVGMGSTRTGTAAKPQSQE